MHLLMNSSDHTGPSRLSARKQHLPPAASAPTAASAALHSRFACLIRRAFSAIGWATFVATFSASCIAEGPCVASWHRFGLLCCMFAE